MFRALADHSHVHVFCHMDHASTFYDFNAGIDHGFTSVMMDGSLEADAATPASYEYNLDITRRVTEMAHHAGVSVEGELGVLGSLETGGGEQEDGHGATGKLSEDQLLTDPEQAVDFVLADELTHVRFGSEWVREFTKDDTERFERTKAFQRETDRDFSFGGAREVGPRREAASLTRQRRRRARRAVVAARARHARSPPRRLLERACLAVGARRSRGVFVESAGRAVVRLVGSDRAEGALSAPQAVALARHERQRHVHALAARARQRRGRAGRAAPGLAVHLGLTRHRHDQLIDDHQPPEVRRVPLEQLVL